MAGGNKDINLIIKARDEAAGAINSATAALNTLFSAQEKVGTSATGTGSKLADMVAAFGSIDKAMATVNGAADKAASAFERQQNALVETKARYIQVRTEADLAAAALAKLTKAADFIGPTQREGGPAKLAADIKAVASASTTLDTEANKLQKSMVAQEAALSNVRSGLQLIGSTAIAVSEAHDRATASIELETQALAKNAAAAENVSAIQQRINANTGVNRAAPFDGSIAKQSSGVLLEADSTFRANEQTKRAAEIRDAAIAYQQFEARARAGAAAMREAAVAEQANADALARLRAEINPLAAIQDNLNAKLKLFRDAAKAGKISADELAEAEKRLTATATRASEALSNSGRSGNVGIFGLKPYEVTNLGYQVNDLVTQVASGTSVTQALAQQGGQILQILPRVQSGLLALAKNPVFLTLAAAVGVLVVGLKELNAQVDRTRDFTALLTVNADGAGYQVEALGKSIAALRQYGVAAEDATAAFKTFIAEGINQDSFIAFTKTAQDMSDALGIALPDAAKQMADAFTGGYDAIVKLDESLNYLSESQREQIRLLFEEGKAQEARTLAYDIFAGKQESAATAARGPWAEAVRSLGVAWSNFLDTVANSAIINAMADALARMAGSVTDLLNKLSGTKSAFSTMNEIMELRDKIQKQKALDPTGIDVGRQNLIREYEATLAKLEARYKSLDEARQKAGGPGVASASGTPGSGIANEESQAKLRARESELRRIQIERDALNKKNLSDAARIAKAGDDALHAERRKSGDEIIAKAAQQLAIDKERLEVEKENAAEAEKAARAAKEAAKFTQFQAPVDGRVSSPYGVRVAPKSGASTFHQGTDYAVPEGTAVRAAADGIVKAIGENAKLGKFVVIDHGKGVETKYGHLSDNQVVGQGAAVTAGQTIAKSGNTGNSTGAHLHYTISVNGNPVDPKQNGGKFEIALSDAVGDKQKVDDKKAEKQQEFNEALDAENRKREQNIESAKALVGVQGEALVNAQQAAFVDEAVRREREKAIKDELTYTAAQEETTRKLAAAEFEATRGAKARAEAARTAVDKPVAQLSSLRDGLQSRINDLQQAGDTQSANVLKPQLDAVIVQLDEAIAKAREFYASLGTANPEAASIREHLNLTAEDIQRIGLELDVTKAKSQQWGTVMGVGAESIANAFATTVTNAMDRFAESVAKGENVFKSMRNAFLQFAADFLKMIAQMIMKQIAFNIAKTVLKSVGVGVPTNHTGGIAGTHRTETRTVSPDWFAGAMRYHTGGIAGLKPNEIPTILEEGEEVLTRADPRHRANLSTNGPSPQGNGTTVVNVFDPADALEKALRSPAGERVLINHVQNNPEAFKAAMG